MSEATSTERSAGLAKALQVEREQHEALEWSVEFWRTALDEGSNQITTPTSSAARAMAT